MRSRLRFWKYPISIILLTLVVAAFTLIYALSITAQAPYEHVDEPDLEVIDAHEPEDETEDPGEIEDEPEEEPEIDIAEIFKYNPSEDGYVTIFMEAADIHKGYLLLVNHDHTFGIPNDFDLVNIVDAKSSPFRVQHNTSMLRQSIIEPLDEMMDAFIAATGNRSVAIISAYRSYDSQQRILNNYISRMGRREALLWAALPGHSEHHTGLAFDFGIMSGNTRSTFTGTGSTAWFRRNSYRFGFILRYQQSKTQITQTSYEPWHFRYVGLPHSIIMQQNNWCLEEYIDLIRNHTMDDPLIQDVDGVQYEIYFSASTEVPVPLFSEFEISGNNVDGFIVTIVRQEHDPDTVVELYI